jgi:hypothetical protein
MALSEDSLVVTRPSPFAANRQRTSTYERVLANTKAPGPLFNRTGRDCKFSSEPSVSMI